MSYTDSDEAESTLTLTGVWLHDPLDAEGTVQQYLYGRSNRTSTVKVDRHGLVYAGRTFPVFDYGEHQDDQVSVQVLVPHGETWAAELAELLEFAEARRTLCYRDNRGRRVFGSLGNYTEDDEDMGTTVSFEMNRADYDEAVA